MHITRLELRQFRNYEQAELRPCEGVTVLYGNNAQGKTALLEAIVLCCTGRSHRTSRDKELIRWGQEAGRVFVQAEKRDGSHEVEMLLSSLRRKTVKVNGSALQRTGELMGHVNGVLFAPEDLRMVKDGPAERRRFIDMELSQIKPSYYYALQHYAHALMQRNKLLRDIALKPSLSDMLEDWDAQLARYRAEIGEYKKGGLPHEERFLAPAGHTAGTDRSARLGRRRSARQARRAEGLDVRQRRSEGLRRGDGAL